MNKNAYIYDHFNPNYMKNKIFILFILMAGILSLVNCKKSNSNDDNNTGTTWNLCVMTTNGDTFVLAKGTFEFLVNTFNVHVITSRIGGGNIVKEFDMSGAKVGDSIFVTDYVLNLTDPVEVVTVNGKIGIIGSHMSGGGTYHIVQPPDTLSYQDSFLFVADKE